MCMCGDVYVCALVWVDAVLGKSLLGAVEAVKLAKARKFGFNKLAIFVTTSTEK